MKPTHRYYTAERGAKFRSGDLELILRKNDLFRLELFEGRPSVVKDGVVYFVNPKLVAALKKRSEVANVAQLTKARIEFMNRNGLSIEKAIVKNTQSLVKDLKGTNVRHAFKDNAVWLAFDTVFEELPHSVMVEVYFGTNSLHVAAYAPDLATIKNWPVLPRLSLIRKKLSKYLIEKYRLEIGKAVARSATYGNIRVAGKPYTGKVFSYAANWSL